MMILFDCELNKERTEWKGTAVQELGIDNYDDPFNDRGIRCLNAWFEGEISECVTHNRACLLKERDILLKRGTREPDTIEFHPL